MVTLGAVFGGRIRDRLRGNGNTANQTWCQGRPDGLYPHPDHPQRFIQVSTQPSGGQTTIARADVTNHGRTEMNLRDI